MSQALYKKLTTDFLSKVQAGEITVGERLPPESEYAAQLGVSRSTVRLAFSLLEENGIIKRTQRGGTKVIADKLVKRYQVVGGDLFNVLGDDNLLTIVVTDVCKVVVEGTEELIGLHDIASDWLSSSAKQYIPNVEVTPLVVKSYIPEYFSDIEVAVGDYVDPLFKLIEQRYNVLVGRVRKSSTAEKCPESVAGSLGLSVGEPVLRDVIKVEDMQGKLMEVVYLYFDTSQCSIESEYRVRT